MTMSPHLHHLPMKSGENSMEVPDTRSELAATTDTKAGMALLNSLIEKALALNSLKVIKWSDMNAWNAIAKHYLVQTFGANSEHIKAVLIATGDAGVWAGMSDRDIQLHLRSCVQKKLTLLASCIQELNIYAGGGQHAQRLNKQ